MTKVSLITIFDNCNFGTYLQCLALCNVLEKFGASVEIVDYRRKFNQYHRLLNPFSKHPLDNIKVFIRNIGIMWVRFREHRYVRKTCHLTHVYNEYSKLKSNPPIADIYLTGSDQVWNTIHNHGIDYAFYLTFAPNGKRKCAYGASIGMSAIPKEYEKETRKLLSQYDYISVREDSNKVILNSIGIPDVDLVLDPTLLFDKSGWGRYVKNRLRPHCKYLLVYSVEKSEQAELVSQVARQVAQEKNFEIVCISYGGKGSRIPGCDKYYYYSTIERFLTLFYFADFTVVSSFHGTAFSINLNKPFITVAPERFASRIDSLLSLTNLMDRKVANRQDLTTSAMQDIDFGTVNSILATWRKKSMGIIRDKILNL